MCVTYDGEIPCGQTATITEDGSATGTYIWNTARCSSVSIIDIFMQSTNAIWNIVVLTMFHVPFQNSVPGSVLLMTYTYQYTDMVYCRELLLFQVQ